jgi:hypothetical protein
VTGKERRKCLKGSSEKMDLSKRRQEVGWPHFRSISSRRRIPGRREKKKIFHDDFERNSELQRCLGFTPVLALDYGKNNYGNPLFFLSRGLYARWKNTNLQMILL